MPINPNHNCECKNPDGHFCALHAAAPDLLAALDDAFRFYGNLFDPELVTKIENAIKKATL